MARAPRRSFAAPFVITLATVPACTVTSAPPPQQPPQPRTAETGHSNPPPPVTETRPDGTSTTVLENPPRPTNPVEPQGGKPKPQTEPKPPMGPTAGVGGEPSTTPPVAAAKDTVWAVAKAGATCQATLRIECPKPEPGKPAMTCNPPPPVDYACPAGWDGKTQIFVSQYAGSTECLIEGPPTNCKPNEKCRKPPSQKVPCPKR